MAAVGRAEMVKGSWLKPGAVVVDVGINHVDDPSEKKGKAHQAALINFDFFFLIRFLLCFCVELGYRLVGDVDFQGCKEVASLITPVRTCCRMLIKYNYRNIFKKTTPPTNKKECS